MNPIQGNTAIWHDNSGIARLSAQVAANDKRRRDARVAAARKAFAHIPPAGKAVLLAIDQIEAAMLPGFDPIKAQESEDLMSMTNDPHLLVANIKSSKLFCPNGFGYNYCEHPACKCHAMPIQSSNIEPPHKPGSMICTDGLVQKDGYSHIDTNRDPSEPASLTHLAIAAIVTALLAALAIVSSPLLLQRATAIVSAWFN